MTRMMHEPTIISLQTNLRFFFFLIFLCHLCHCVMLILWYMMKLVSRGAKNLSLGGQIKRVLKEIIWEPLVVNTKTSL